MLREIPFLECDGQKKMVTFLTGTFIIYKNQNKWSQHYFAAHFLRGKMPAVYSIMVNLIFLLKFDA